MSSFLGVLTNTFSGHPGWGKRGDSKRGIDGGGLVPAAINNLSSFEGIHPNVIRVEGLPVAPDKDVKDLERELFLRMQVGAIIGELTVVLHTLHHAPSLFVHGLAVGCTRGK